MARVFTWEFDVRSYELGAFRHVNNAVYHNYLEDCATRASADAGFGHDWYFRQGRAWVVREMTIRYLTPLRFGDRARVRTWVSDFRRIYSHREYDMRRAADDQPVVRARAKWVYINLETMRPERIPAEFEPAFQPTGELETIDIELHDPVVFADAPHYLSDRRVQFYELDPTGHVNNSVYLNWFEQAMVDALEQAGWTVAGLQEIGLGIMQAGHRIEYLRPAFAGERLQVISQPVGVSGAESAWQHEIRLAESGDVITRDYSVATYVDRETGQPRELPDPVLESLLSGRPDGRGHLAPG